MLHAALRHGERIAHRDPYLWNVACDFVINGWLVEMGVGELPEGVLYDPELAGLSSEAVYDRIATDLRRFRRLATLRGRGLGDVLAPGMPGMGETRRAADLDDFYRRALVGGLAFHESSGRGLLPAGLVDEIRVLDHPPLPWDVRLARWFDAQFPAVDRVRSYARPSRRQASTPEIPRPGWARPTELVTRRTFGVVLDTSGSMDRRLLGKALGAIASYATARDVPAARVVFCDAAAYDAGYLPVADIAGRVRIRGRGGTVLQPGIRLLERAEDFPADGPILIITDAMCDVVRVRRAHAFLVPAAARLPFTPPRPGIPYHPLTCQVGQKACQKRDRRLLGPPRRGRLSTTVRADLTPAGGPVGCPLGTESPPWPLSTKPISPPGWTNAPRSGPRSSRAGERRAAPTVPK